MSARTQVGPRARARARLAGALTLAGPLALVVALASCGDDSGDGGDAVEIRPTSYVTQPVTVTSSTAPATGPGGSVEEGHVPGTQDYTIRRGDFLSGIAADFDVDMRAICEVNDWDDCESHLLVPGEVITIPPGARDAADIEAEAESETEDSGDGDTDATEDETDTGGSASGDGNLCPNGDEQGTYTIQDTDTTRTAVANRLDVTVEQLDEANANTPGYSAFYPGLEILVPCGED